MGKVNGLTPKQQLWVDEYLKDLNATQAAIRAGYSKHTAKQIGTENLAKPALAAAVAARQSARAAKTEITQEWVVNRLKEEATLTGEGSTHSGRVRAVELLGKHLGMFEDRKAADVNELLAELLRDAIRGDVSDRSQTGRPAEPAREAGGGGPPAPLADPAAPATD